jgi:hypothetical protein
MVVFGSECVKKVPLVFYSMLFTSWTHECFTELHYNVAESIVIV